MLKTEKVNNLEAKNL